MRLQVTDDCVDVRLARWEKVLGLMGDIRLERSQVSDVTIVEDPVREAMRAGLKAGLRLPGLCYVCRTIKLDRVWVVRRGVPAVSFAVAGHAPLQRVTLSTRDAKGVLDRLRPQSGRPGSNPVTTVANASKD
jgi:hypothetical protein